MRVLARITARSVWLGRKSPKGPRARSQAGDRSADNSKKSPVRAVACCLLPRSVASLAAFPARTSRADLPHGPPHGPPARTSRADLPHGPPARVRKRQASGVLPGTPKPGACPRASLKATPIASSPAAPALRSPRESRPHDPASSSRLATRGQSVQTSPISGDSSREGRLARVDDLARGNGSREPRPRRCPGVAVPAVA